MKSSHFSTSFSCDSINVVYTNNMKVKTVDSVAEPIIHDVICKKVGGFLKKITSVTIANQLITLEDRKSVV